MLKKSPKKSHDDFLWDFIEAYRKEHERAFRMENVAKWILDNELLPPPRVHPVRLMTRTLKQAARRRRFRDTQGRTVRQALAVKVKHVDAKRNLFFVVVWDYLHEMSLDHALAACSQRDENIEKQRLAAARDVQSILDNNPNVAQHKGQFKFNFMREEPVVVVHEALEETPVALPTSPEQIEATDVARISKKKPR